MTLKLLETACLGGSDTLALASLVTLTATGNPTYLVVDALDRDEYTAAATGATGSFSGDGDTLGLTSIGGDGRGAGIVFTWQASLGQYVNAIYGSLSRLDFTQSTSAGDITNLSFFGTNTASLAQYDANNAYALMQQDGAGYLGSVTAATTSAAPTEATPDGVAEAALAMVGQAWNEDGCWVLASTIAAEAGAGLPVQSTEVGRPGSANGEWIVLYNGPSAANANWKNLVSTGDMVVFATSSTTGHITTCVSGSGSTAMLVDNITYIGQGGAIVNSANDGSYADVTIAPPHAAAQEFAGVSPGSVVIYALDTPAMTEKVAAATLTTGSTVGLATLFAASDPGHKSITSYQVYDSGGTDTLLLKGHAAAAGATLTAALLSQLSLSAGGAPTSDTLEIRASNGTYWGDWQSLNVDIIAAPPKPSAPVLLNPERAQTVAAGSAFSFALPAASFADPQGEKLSFRATLSTGAALPAWLKLLPATEDFSGTAPARATALDIKVIATDTSGMSASENFTLSVGDWASPGAAAAVLQATQVTYGLQFAHIVAIGSDGWWPTVHVG
jgi:hypothetical protein